MTTETSLPLRYVFRLLEGQGPARSRIACRAPDAAIIEQAAAQFYSPEELMISWAKAAPLWAGIKIDSQSFMSLLHSVRFLHVTRTEFSPSIEQKGKDRIAKTAAAIQTLQENLPRNIAYAKRHVVLMARAHHTEIPEEDAADIAAMTGLLQAANAAAHIWTGYRIPSRAQAWTDTGMLLAERIEAVVVAHGYRRPGADKKGPLARMIKEILDVVRRGKPHGDAAGERAADLGGIAKAIERMRNKPPRALSGLPPGFTVLG